MAMKHKRKDYYSYEEDISACLDLLENLGIKTAGADYMGNHNFHGEAYMYDFFQRIKTKITLIKGKDFYRQY